MSRLKIRIAPASGCDIAALELWLAQMAAKGLTFSFTAGPLTFFDPTPPAQVQVHLEPIQGAVEEDPELNAIFEAAGWRYLGMFRGSYFVFSTQELQAQAHTDPEALDYALKRFFRRALLGGVGLLLFNVLLLAFFRPGRNSLPGFWNDLRWFPLEALSRYKLIPLTLSVLGLALADLSCLLGLRRLWAYRRAVRAGTAPLKKRRAAGGWLAAAAIVLLLPVLAHLAVYFTGRDYTPYPLEGSGFVTLAQVEGPDFRLSGDPMYNMDYISHGDTPLTPESWYFRQYGAFSHYDGGIGLNDVPRLEIQIYRYLLPALAAQQADEWSRTSYNGSGAYQDLGAGDGLDQALYAVREGRTAENGRAFQPGAVLILRRGNAVLRADYRGDKDLLRLLPDFAGMFDLL